MCNFSDAKAQICVSCLGGFSRLRMTTEMKGCKMKHRPTLHSFIIKLLREETLEAFYAMKKKKKEIKQDQGVSASEKKVVQQAAVGRRRKT